MKWFLACYFRLFRSTTETKRLIYLCLANYCIAYHWHWCKAVFNWLTTRDLCEDILPVFTFNADLIAKGKLTGINLDSNKKTKFTIDLRARQKEKNANTDFGFISAINRAVDIKVALRTEGAERRWVRQAVMGVLRWRDLPGTRSATGTLRSLSTSEVNSTKLPP